LFGSGPLSSGLTDVRRFRDAAQQLRDRVSHGSYDDDELRQFWELCALAEAILQMTGAELAERANFGETFFLTVVRDRRRPKLTNFLRALTTFVEAADQRLRELGQSNAAVATEIVGPLEEKAAEIYLLSKSLGQMAREEIDRLDAARANDPTRRAIIAKQRELLVLFAEGFEKIASTLRPADKASRNFDKAKKAISNLARGLDAWWMKNQGDAVDWIVRIPVLTAGVGALNLVGANMTVATSAVAALVGGPKVIDVIRKRKKP
jgi:hypothetical protein